MKQKTFRNFPATCSRFHTIQLQDKLFWIASCLILAFGIKIKLFFSTTTIDSRRSCFEVSVLWVIQYSFQFRRTFFRHAHIYWKVFLPSSWHSERRRKRIHLQNLFTQRFCIGGYWLKKKETLLLKMSWFNLRAA